MSIENLQMAIWLLSFTIGGSLVIALILFFASGQIIRGIIWCAGLFLGWAFVNGLFITATAEAAGNPASLRTATSANLCVQITMQILVLVIIGLLRRDVRKHWRNTHCPKCGSSNTGEDTFTTGSYLTTRTERRTIQHYNRHGHQTGHSEYSFEVPERKREYSSARQCKNCRHRWSAEAVGFGGYRE